MAERSVQGGPNDAGRHVQLGMILALLGEKERAIAEGKRAVELVPESTDAFDGPDFAIALAQIYSWTGEKDKALQIIERSLSIPAGITAPMLKVDPVWEPLHGDPRFQALLAKYAGP
jgi:tetratricopeptide (TPR) repeat protein